MEVEACSFTAGLCYGFARGVLDLYYRDLTAALTVRATSELDHLRCAAEYDLVDVRNYR